MSRQTDLILKMLEENKYVTNLEMNPVAYRYSARIAELREAGHLIEKEYIKPGVWAYRLVRPPVQMELADV